MPADARSERGRLIAEKCRIDRKGDEWLVPSQSGPGRYTVRVDGDYPRCTCPVCARWSRAYLRHLLRVGEPSAARLLTIHNVHWTIQLVVRARAAIRAGDLASLRSEVAATWP